MAKTDYLRTDFTGGGANDLDGIDGATLNDGDRGMVITAAYGCYHYVLDASIGGTEQVPLLVAPDLNPGSKRWVLLSVEGARSGLVNLLGGAALMSVWSQSDTNKGLGTIVYDNLAISTYQAGEVITGQTSGAVCKVISDNGATTMVIGAATGRFQDDEQILGATSGATADVNIDDTVAGPDQVANGDFTVNDDPPNSWTASNATLTTDAAVIDVGNCMKVLDGGAGNGYAYQSCTTVIGELYTFSCWAEDVDTGQNGLIEVGTAAGDATYYSSGAITADAGARYTVTFEATTTTTFISLNCTSLGGAYYFDSVSLWTLRPCCTGADAKAPDGWYKDTTLDLYREHHGANVPEGVFYSTLSVPTAQNDFCLAPAGYYDNEEWFEPVAGETYTIAAYVKSSTASDFRVTVSDGVATTYSSYHSGGGAFEWLEISATMNANPTEFTFGWHHGSATPGNVYIGAVMLIKGSSIGEGNFCLQPGAQILCEEAIALIDYTTTINAIDGIINLEGQSSGKIPKGTKAVLIKAYGKDNAAGDGIGFDIQSVITVEDGISVDTQVNNIVVQGQGWVKCDSNGDVYFDHRGSGAAALTVDIKIIGTEV